MWERDIAENYDRSSAAMFAPAMVDPVVERLAELAGSGAALELAIGTGRIALPLAARGVHVHGIELSQAMADVLAAKSGADAVPVVVGDMTTAKAPGNYSLVYLVWNAITNVTTQDDQVAVFANAAAHLRPGGFFVVEVLVPQLRGLPPGERGRVFELSPEHVAVETFDDVVGQVSWSHHWMDDDGRMLRHSAPYRYVWPSELDLMARLTGFRVRDRWAGWQGEPFTSDSIEQVVVFERV